MTTNDLNKQFPITSVCKADILQCYEGLEGTEEFKNVEKILETVNDLEMEHLANKLSGDYCEQLFWVSLKNLFESKFL